MRILIGAVGLALLAGCVSPSELKRNAPVTQAVTGKSPRDYALCVFPKWQDARLEASMSETERGYRLVIGDLNLVDELLEVTKTSSGSSVAHFQRMPWFTAGRGVFGEAVRACL